MSMQGAPSPGGSPFGQRKSFRKFEKQLSEKNLFSRKESGQSEHDDFRAIARRISRSGGSTQLLDPAARLAALKKLEAEEKLKMQKEIEDLKSKMNSVETVEKTGFKYDPSKVRGQIESEMKETEELVDAAPEDEDGDEYKKWLEEIMSQGWSEEVKELVEGRKKVSKRNLIRARKRSIVRRYTLIIPEVIEDYDIPPEEDEFTEQEKLRQTVEKEFDGINLEYSIESLSNNKEWSAEIQELVVAKKKINHHNLRNARKRNIVKQVQQLYPGCVYQLQLDPDEFTELEILRRNIDSQIAEIRIIIESEQDFDVVVTLIQKKWKFDVSQLDLDKKKRNRKNIFNYVVRQIIRDGKEQEPDLNYEIDLEEDDYTDEEIKFQEYERRACKIDGAFLGKSASEIQAERPDITEDLCALDYRYSKDNFIRMMKLLLCRSIYGENVDVTSSYMLSEEHFEMSDKALAKNFICSALSRFNDKLDQTDELDYDKAFVDQAEVLRVVKAKLNCKNLRMCFRYETESEAVIKFPDCDVSPKEPEYELTEDGAAYYALKEQLVMLDGLLATIGAGDLFGKREWNAEERYLLENNYKPTVNNIINARKRNLCYEFQKKHYKSDLVDGIELEEYSAEELYQQKLNNKQKEKEQLTRALSQELEEITLVLENAHRKSEIESSGISGFLSDEWLEEVNSLAMAGLSVNRQNLYDIKAIHILERYKRENCDMKFDDFKVRRNPFESDVDEEPSTENESEMGCLSCEMRSRSSFFEESTEASSQNLDRIEEDEVDVDINEPVITDDDNVDGIIGSDDNIANKEGDILQGDVAPGNSRTAEQESKSLLHHDEFAITNVLSTPETLYSADTKTAANNVEEGISTNHKVEEHFSAVSDNDELGNNNSLEQGMSTDVQLSDKFEDAKNSLHENANKAEEQNHENEDGKNGEEEGVNKNLANLENDSDCLLQRPTILMSEGFTPNPGSSISDLDSSKLPTSLVDTPRDPIASPFPTHGYVSPSKTFDSRFSGSQSFHPSVESQLDTDSIEDSAYESRQSAKSEDETLAAYTVARFPRTDNLPESNATVNSVIDLADQLLPFTLHRDSVGSDNVFEGAGASSSRLSGVLTPNQTEPSDANAPPAVEIEEVSGNEGDIELSPSDDAINESNPSACNLPERTMEILKNISESSDDEKSNQQNIIRTPKRKKLASPGEAHPTIKRQEEYIKRTSVLEAKRLELSKSKESLDADGNDKTPSQSYQDGGHDKYQHIKSSYKAQKGSPYLDRTKYVKVPTLEDKIVRSKPLMEGLIPKEFYDQKFSFDVRSVAEAADLIDTTTELKPRQRSVSEVVLSSAPTTGHILWNMMKERKLEREKAEEVTDLDLAVCHAALFLLCMYVLKARII